MRITVTGAAGFIGSHLVPELQQAGHEVHGFDRRDGDLANVGEASYLIQRASPEIVIHLAAQVGRQFGDQDARFTITQNAIVTAHVAKWSQTIGARLVYASTSEVYGDKDSNDVYEDTPLSLPYNLYGLSKRWGEEVADLLNENVAQMRLAMPYGPGLPAGMGRAAIINFLAQAHRDEPILVHRDSERCWCWIKDTVRAIRLIAESEQTGPFNVGRDDNPTSMYDVAKLAKFITGSNSTIEEIEPPGNQVLVKRLKTDRLRKLGWQPTVDLEDGMRLTYHAMLDSGELEKRKLSA